jgi:FtsP/CotA-like multicopper oxidase with cupredoxin domain
MEHRDESKKEKPTTNPTGGVWSFPPDMALENGRKPKPRPTTTISTYTYSGIPLRHLQLASYSGEKGWGATSRWRRGEGRAIDLAALLPNSPRRPVARA